MPQFYQVFGLHIVSELDLPELIPAASVALADIEIGVATLTPATEAIDSSDAQAPTPSGLFEFAVDGVARYRILEGKRILVDPALDAAPGDVRLWLLGTGLGVALHQRGLLPLHVSAVRVGDGAFAFCGESGAGKSTLAAALHSRALPVLTDDVGLAIPEADRVLLHPGFPRIKLWRDALGHFGLDHTELIQDLTRSEKYHLRLAEGFHAAALPLRAIYLLERAETDQPCIEPVRGYAAIDLIRAQTYRWELVHDLGLSAGHLRACSLVAQRVSIFRFRRPWRLDRLDAALDVLLDHMRRH
jgi:hypothetical protein